MVRSEPKQAGRSLPGRIELLATGTDLSSHLGIVAPIEASVRLFAFCGFGLAGPGAGRWPVTACIHRPPLRNDRQLRRKQTLRPGHGPVSSRPALITAAEEPGVCQADRTRKMKVSQPRPHWVPLCRLSSRATRLWLAGHVQNGAAGPFAEAESHTLKIPDQRGHRGHQATALGVQQDAERPSQWDSEGLGMAPR